MHLSNFQSILRERIGTSDMRKGIGYLMPQLNEKIKELEAGIIGNNLNVIENKIADVFLATLSIANYYKIDLENEKHLLDVIENAVTSEGHMIDTISKEDIVIIISGWPGCGKSTIAKIISERFGLKRVSGGDALKELAAEKGFKPGGKDWWESPDGTRFLNLRYKDSSFDAEADRKLIEMGKKGNIILDGWPIPWLFDGGFKIWLEADRKMRAGRIVERDQINSDVAMKLMAEREEKMLDAIGT